MQAQIERLFQVGELIRNELNADRRPPGYADARADKSASSGQVASNCVGTEVGRDFWLRPKIQSRQIL